MGITKKIIESIFSKYMGGDSIQKIAKDMGLPEKLIENVLKRYELKIVRKFW